MTADGGASNGATASGVFLTIQMILAPLFVQVLLTFVIGFWLAGLRTAR